MDDSLETFVPLTFRRRGSLRPRKTDQHIHPAEVRQAIRALCCHNCGRRNESGRTA